MQAYRSPYPPPPVPPMDWSSPRSQSPQSPLSPSASRHHTPLSRDSPAGGAATPYMLCAPGQPPMQGFVLPYQQDLFERLTREAQQMAPMSPGSGSPGASRSGSPFLSPPLSNPSPSGWPAPAPWHGGVQQGPDLPHGLYPRPPLPSAHYDYDAPQTSHALSPRHPLPSMGGFQHPQQGHKPWHFLDTSQHLHSPPFTHAPYQQLHPQQHLQRHQQQQPWLTPGLIPDPYHQQHAYSPSVGHGYMGLSSDWDRAGSTQSPPRHAWTQGVVDRAIGMEGSLGADYFAWTHQRRQKVLDAYFNRNHQRTMRVLRNQKDKADAAAALEEAIEAKEDAAADTQERLWRLAKRMDRDAYEHTGYKPLKLLKVDEVPARINAALDAAIDITQKKSVLEAGSGGGASNSSYQRPTDLHTLMDQICSPEWYERMALPANLETLKIALDVRSGMLELSRLHDASMRASSCAAHDREVQGQEAVHAMRVQAALLQDALLTRTSQLEHSLLAGAHAVASMAAVAIKAPTHSSPTPPQLLHQPSLQAQQLQLSPAYASPSASPSAQQGLSKLIETAAAAQRSSMQAASVGGLGSLAAPGHSLIASASPTMLGAAVPRTLQPAPVCD